MIKANELRLGNYILAGKILEPFRVLNIQYEIKDGFIINKSIPESHLRPIPLTPEILIKCGFVNIITDVEWDLQDNSFYLVRSYGTNYFRHYKTDVKYLHHLQNLYFALTGNELIIDLLKEK